LAEDGCGGFGIRLAVTHALGITQYLPGDGRPSCVARLSLTFFQDGNIHV